MGKANVVADALSRKSVGPSERGMCMRISVDSPLLGLIRATQAEGVRKENWKQERIRAEVSWSASNISIPLSLRFQSPTRHLSSFR
ncbi:unnamed protein product [Lactuca virosa]|uniref:Reverse transcriptase RNase H-like domain-containing protein n=1 Tax=Lactuca virosa TaxID=75947 RepID=A0AAU9MKD6_9ASTR|nr:unnamed protein product [Lactuca virosa]